LIVPALLFTRCLFPSLDGLASGGDASVLDASDAPIPVDASADAPTLGTYVQELTADAPASWWRLGESSTGLPAKDEMGVQDGTYRVPGITLGAAGAISQDGNTAASFDGTNGAMFLPGTFYDLGGSPPFAIEIWIAPGPPSDASDPLRRIVSHRTSAPYFGWFFAIDNTQRLVFSRWDQNATVASMTSAPLTEGQWAHAVVTGDGTTMTLYVNGASVASGPEGAITANVAATALAFGAQSDFSIQWFDGSLDEPAIYTHALAPARVLAHYQAGIGK
jgi:hypothetical protein